MVKISKISVILIYFDISHTPQYAEYLLLTDQNHLKKNTFKKNIELSIDISIKGWSQYIMMENLA